MSPVNEQATPSGLRRSLGVRDLMVYGLLFIAPMAPVGVFGVLDAKSHGAVATVYLAATVAMGLTAFSYAQMVRAVPQTGSVFAYARAGLGEGPGFIAGWMAMLDYLLIPAVAYLFSGIALHSLVPGVSRWLWTAIAVVVTTALNLVGVRTAAVVGFAVLAMEIAVLLAFMAAAVVALAQDGARRGWDTPFTAVGDFSLTAVVSAVSVAVLSYLGFDAIATFVEEAVGASAAVARAVLWCLALAGVLFVAQTYLAAVLEPMSPQQLAADPAAQGSAFYDTVESGVGHWLHVLVAAGKAIGAAFAALAGQAAAGRLVFAMSRDGRLPRVLGTVDPASAVPRRALLAAAVITMAAAVWAANRDDGLDQLTSVVNVGALTAFALLHASVIGWYTVRHGSRDRLRHLVVPALGIAVIGAVVYEASTTAQLVGLTWLAVGLVVLGVQGSTGSTGPGGSHGSGAGGVGPRR
ncbi:amino acid/polyamine/organocation transporter (APC superfamily) [Streptomyces sp. 1114.5]|uniref:APC family permease n=1 Tax=Streptomyces sp. 1114.5 TaxID=1938830 RepID=UPI000EB1BCD0|nr:APC family permease [Streptomyces sp. 1114.5]RKT16124.1 amino acid/polyamine/organocation transporter (APC superfamily) [Streptomyces sp. 1114.5]